MTALFLKVFNGSISASYLILAVLLARQLLKKAPKYVRVALWGIVGIRLACPISLESALSLIPSARTVPETIALSPAPALDTGFVGLDQAVNPVLSQAVAPQVEASANPMQVYLSVAAWVWVMGFSAMLLYTVISYFRLDLKMGTAVRYWRNVYQSEKVDSPFVLGLFRPQIYLPFSLDSKTMEHVIAHEQAHIRRKDHWWKPLGFLLVSIHWFNPLVWLSYVLLCRDIELACDEKVIRELTPAQRADYSQALLICSLHRRPISACPLAFGEVGVKDRVKSILHYRKPTFWVLLISAVVCGVLAVCFLTDPREDAASPTEVPALSTEATQVGEASTATVPTTEPGEVSANALQLSELAYYLELAFPEETFQAMDPALESEMLTEYQNYLEGYLTLARQSADGTNSYILGLYTEIDWTTADSDTAAPLYGSLNELTYPLPDGRILHYPPPETEAAQAELENFWASVYASNALPATLPQGYWVTRNTFSIINQGALILIQSPDNTCNLGQIAANYLPSAQGRAYVADAAARGVSLTQPETPYLQIFLVHPTFGETTEYLPLTDALAQSILAQPRVSLHRGYDFGATLYLEDQSFSYSAMEGVPQTVLDMAIAQCGYTFASPEDVSAAIVEARFDCPWLDEPIYAKEEDLPRLEEILKNAAFGYMGACGYGAWLHLTLADGSTLTLAKGTDECDSIAFGSWGGYFLGDADNTEFWHIFGLTETDHLLLNN